MSVPLLCEQWFRVCHCRAGSVVGDRTQRRNALLAEQWHPKGPLSIALRQRVEKPLHFSLCVRIQLLPGRTYPRLQRRPGILDPPLRSKWKRSLRAQSPGRGS